MDGIEQVDSMFCRASRTLLGSINYSDGLHSGTDPTKKYWRDARLQAKIDSISYFFLFNLRDPRQATAHLVELVELYPASSTRAAGSVCGRILSRKTRIPVLTYPAFLSTIRTLNLIHVRESNWSLSRWIAFLHGVTRRIEHQWIWKENQQCHLSDW